MTPKYPELKVAAQIETQKTAAYERIKQGVLSIIDVVLALGQRTIPLRGNWLDRERKEDGNFMFFVNWKSQIDRCPTKKKTFRRCSKKI